MIDTFIDKEIYHNLEFEKKFGIIYLGHNNTYKQFKL